MKNWLSKDSDLGWSLRLRSPRNLSNSLHWKKQRAKVARREVREEETRMTRKKRRPRMLTISWTSPYLRMILRPAYSPLTCLSSVTTKMRGKSWSSASLNSSRFLSTNSSKAYSSRRLLDSPLSHRHLTTRILRLKLKNNSRCFNFFRNKWKT